MDANKYSINHAALTDTGLKRNKNEDAIGFIETATGYVFVVCDGMGGRDGGDVASKAGVRFIIEYLSNNLIENPAISLHRAIQFANEQIYIAAHSLDELKGMGTTAALLLFHNDEIFTAHVGDSRVYVLTDDNFLQLTKDHSVVQNIIDSGAITEAEAIHHPRKNEITKAIGTKEEVIPTVSAKSLRAKKGDRFIICSDGLSGLINKELLKGTVKNISRPADCAHDLVELAKKGGGDDNISVQVIDVIHSPFTKSEYYLQDQKKYKRKKRRRNPVWFILSGFLFIVTIVLSYIILSRSQAGSTKDSRQSIPRDTSSKPTQSPSGVKYNASSPVQPVSGFIDEDSLRNDIDIYLHNENVKDSIQYIDSLNNRSYNFFKTKKLIDSLYATDGHYLFRLKSKMVNTISIHSKKQDHNIKLKSGSKKKKIHKQRKRTKQKLKNKME